MARRWRWVRGLRAIILAIFCVSIAQPAALYAENTNVIIGVGDTTTLFTGNTSPGALVNIMEGGAVLGTTTALADGSYSHLLTNQAPGIHTYQLGAQDTSGRFTDTVSAVANIQEHTQTTISTFLPPTIALSTNQLSSEQNLTVNGATAPNANVIIYIDNSSYQTVMSNALGEWEHVIAASSLNAGTHQLHAIASKIGLGQSHPSEPRNFTILAPQEEPTKPPPATPPSSPGTTPPSTGGSRPQPPVITSPRPGQVVGSSTVEVSGTSQPGMQIEIWNRGQVVGSVFADANGKWRLSITVKDFANELKARACLGRVCSDFSATVQFFYQAPATGAGPEIKLNRYRWQTFTGEGIGITAWLRGGDTPYELVVDWGDGHIDRYKTTGPQILLSHTFAKPGKYNGKATITDEQGRQASAQFSVEVQSKHAGLSWIELMLRILALLLGLLLIVWLLRRWWLVRQRQGRTEEK